VAKPTKVKYDDSDDDSYANDGCRSDDDDEDEDYSKDDLLGIIDQMSKGYKRMTKKCKMLEQELMVKCNESKALVEELETLKKSKECKGLEQSSKLLENPLMSSKLLVSV
jgi:altronate dehydratase